MTARSGWLRAAAIFAVVLVLDQVTKALVRADVQLGSREDLFAGVDLVHVKNRGVAFSALSDQAELVITVIVLAIVGLLVYFARNATKAWVWLPVGMLAGGAIGNVVDRIARGSVTDFLKLPSWPAFNVADVAITGGVIALVVVVELTARREARASS